MDIPAGKVAILDSVGAAMRVWRAQIRLNVIFGLIGAAAMTVLSLLTLSVATNQSLSLLVMMVSTVAAAFVYAAYLIVDLHGAPALRARLPGDGAQLWGAMALVSFFLCMIFVVAAIPGLALIFTAMRPYMPEIERAGHDQAAVLAIVERFAEANVGLLLAILMIYGIILLLITSRLYLAAPATVKAGRILSFETWAWTKNNMLRIAAARLILLTPASILVFAVQALIGGALGVKLMDPMALQAATATSPAAYALVVFCGHAVNFALYRGLEAALSSQMLKRLRPTI